MTDSSTALVSTASAPKVSFLDAFSRAFSDCIEEELNLLAADAVDDIGPTKTKGKDTGVTEERNADDVQEGSRENGEDARELVTVVKDPEQVSRLPSVGTTLHQTPTDGDTTLDGDIDDEKSDFLSEKQDLLRIPSKIAFKPMKGRSFALEVRQSDLGLVREGNVADVMKSTSGDWEERDDVPAEIVSPKKKETRKQRRQWRKQKKQKSSTTTTFIKKREVVQGQEGMEIMTVRHKVELESPSKKPRRWNLRRRFRKSSRQ